MKCTIRPRKWDGSDPQLCLASEAIASGYATFDQLVEMEGRCFPVDEAGTHESMGLRLREAGDYFTAVHDGEKVIGFINATRCTEFLEETMSDHDPKGSILAIHSVVCDLPYRRMGIAHAMLTAYVDVMTAKHRDIKTIALIAKAYLVGFYVSCGFVCNSLSPIVHGADPWFDFSLDTDSYRRQSYAVVDAFVTKSVTSLDTYATTGNPAAIVCLPRDSKKTDAWMQGLALEINLSETAYVLPLTDDRVCNEWQLRWFTPTVEVKLCGHATLASAHRLWESGQADTAKPIRFHSVHSGILVARCEQKLDELIITLDFPIDVVKPLDDLSESYRNFITEALGLKDWQVANNKSPVVRVADSRYQIAEIRPEAFSSIEPQYGVMARLEGSGRSALIATTAGDVRNGDAHFTSRFFAPNLGVSEDPVTGSAHCVLGAFWREYLQWKTMSTTKSGASSDMIEMIAYQSSERGGDLTLHVSPNKHDNERIYLSGVAVSRMQGSIL
ncbi:hypothetical protein SARC_11332 [Sphaeroforma arctica JP610]|uniref:N-acetyltransferase domain-containing protein n=1 Tax=Sphaeroforma arctica JP610 TaxID=667725 RepID=A0A0L0FJG3_9EUKA|nr:hypothetical protein SARC_11332 [Sphaeroforma arctica JP610]KNC76158.1 hypothetical protein SARC_11332 [Sphaeroforma arctica JP610]|eukprot:XP_014150060.1 hypothetical protein SARC_11332 [Sphaeroforma arctica JP610]